MMMHYSELKALIKQHGVHAVFGAPGAGWGIEQNAHELAIFLVAMQSLGIRSCLEIGTGYRGGLSRFLAAALGWDVTTVDIENYGHEFPGVRYTILHDDIPYTYSDLLSPYYDLVIIDAAHTYETVCLDYDCYKNYATKAIMFHDIAGLRDCEGVAQFWYELAYQGDDELHDGFYEAIEDSDQRGGIGWLVL